MKIICLLDMVTKVIEMGRDEDMMGGYGKWGGMRI